MLQPGRFRTISRALGCPMEFGEALRALVLPGWISAAVAVGILFHTFTSLEHLA